MKSTGTLYARIAEASIRKSAQNRDYLSIKAELLDERQAEKSGPVWITSFHKSHIAAGIGPGMEIEARGVIDYARDSENKPRLWLTADFIALLISAPAKETECHHPKPAPPANNLAAVHGSIPGTENGAMPSGSVISAGQNIAPKNKPKRTSRELTALAFGAEATGDKGKYGNGVDWDKGDDISDLWR